MDQRSLSYLDGLNADVMARRHSVRAYNGKPLLAEHVTALNNFCAEFQPNPSVRCCLITEQADELFRFALGFGAHKHVPAAVAFIAQKNHYFDAGFIGECCLLYATKLGISSCFVALFNKKFAPHFFSTLPLSPTEEIVCVSPLGYTDTTPKAHKRLPLATVAQVNPSPAWHLEAAKNALLAPSALNCQPCRYSSQKNALLLSLVTLDKLSLLWPTKNRHIDAGIAMAHLQCTTNALGIPTTFEKTTATSYLLSPAE